MSFAASVLSALSSSPGDTLRSEVLRRAARDDDFGELRRQILTLARRDGLLAGGAQAEPPAAAAALSASLSAPVPMRGPQPAPTPQPRPPSAPPPGPEVYLLSLIHI